MSQHLTSNKWGFSVEHDNPFAIFRVLQRIARESVGEVNVIDLSRGDPGYGFTSSRRGRSFYGYLSNLDTLLNNEDVRMINNKKENYESIMGGIGDFTREYYSKEKAEELLNDLNEFIDKVKKMANECDLDWSDFDVIFETFKYSAVTGGSYLNPQGELITRVILAGWYKQFISTDISPDDFILFNGASHAIGTLFKALGEEGLNYLNAESTVAISSPVYSPYNASLVSRGIGSFDFSVNPLTGKVNEATLAHLATYDGKVQAMLLIDPNNPTGYTQDEDTLEKLAHIARNFDCMVISDEVYASFFPKKKTIVDYCPERVLRIDARSKIERSTGLRFGDIFISKEANQYISENILEIPGGMDFKSYLLNAKAPGGVLGEFQHTTFVPGPAQFMGSAHMVLGDRERDHYFKAVAKNGSVFNDVLKLPHQGNMYYVIFDLNKVEGANKQDVPIEEKLTEIAKRGVVLMPANLFFSEMDRSKEACMNMVRASVVNTGAENIKKAAEITRNYLTN